jgi:hypothetical protein
MKMLKSGLALLSVVVLLSGCTTTSNNKQKEMNEKAKKIKDNLAKISKQEESEAKKFAVTNANNYFKALKEKDYVAFCKSKKMSKKQFVQWHKSVTKVYGKLQSQSYIGSISNPLVIRYMWKWNFTKKGKGKTKTREALYNVFIAKDKEKNKYVLFTTGLQ